MNQRLSELLGEVKDLEIRITEELRANQERLRYSIERKKVTFEKEVVRLHRTFVTSLPKFIIDAPLGNIITAPIIYSLILPAVILDLFATVYQFICFPVYGIQKVRRSDHIVIDRQYLKYLNLIEKINCYYCGYFNGVISYAREMAGRTEQYWCPIKHARRAAGHHGHYHKFCDYGDAEGYRARLHEIRAELKDLEQALGDDE